jgi:hypothetical protein
MPSITKDAHLRQVTPLPDVARDLAPQSVALASDQVRTALDRHTAARREVEQAQADADAARRADRRAAADAAEADKRPPRAKLEKAAAALEDAQRRQQGAADALHAARAAFVAELRKHADTIHTALEADTRRAGQDAAEHVDAIEQAMIRRSTLNQTLSGLVEPVGAFRTGGRRKRRRDPLGGPQRATLEQLRGVLGLDAEQPERRHRHAPGRVPAA